MNNNWVALPEVTDSTEGEITMGYTGMPTGLDLERIEINVSALRRGVIGRGGFASLTLACYEGDQDQFNVGVGASDSGTAYATAATSITKAKSSNTTSTSDRSLNAMDIRNGSLNIQWNITALNNRISLDQQYDPSTRAKQLDNVIRNDVIKGVFHHNVTDVIKDKPLIINSLGGFIDGSFFYSLGSDFIKQDYETLVSSLGARGMVMVMVRGLQSVLRKVDFKDMITDQVLLLCRPTRAVTAIGGLATQRLVRSK